ncbi:MAG TPA: YMGG-like glycine zipper-containing protein [Gemmatimonadaceae bacterium]|nr:YMGG-like glycine zipper-containing protein [Gemmatimonadaceae bacterium]
MNAKFRTPVALIAVAVLTALSACKDTKKGDDVLAQDTSLTSDLALANKDTASQPQLTDVPVATTPEPAPAEPAPAPAKQRTIVRTLPRPVAKAPVKTTPAPEPTERVTATGNTERVTPAGSEARVGVVSSGSEISLSSGQRICTNTNSVGDRFTAQISDGVMGGNGTVIPVGATATVEITSLAKSQGEGDKIEMGLRVESVSFGGKTYPVIAETTYAQVDRVRAESRASDTKKVVTGAAIGAVLGQILGHKTKSTVIGAATGAAAGAVVASRNANYDGCVPSGGRITIRLTQPLTIQATE